MPGSEPGSGPGAGPCWTIRRASAAEIPAIVALEAEGFARPWHAAIYGEEIGRAGAWTLVAEGEGGAIVGFVCAWKVLDACHLLRIASRGELRGRGIGRALVEHLAGLARAAGCVHVELEVASQNAPAIRLYERCGFEVVGRRPRYYRDPVDDALLMNLPL